MPKKIGCEDCGAVYAKKTDVPKSCRPYAVYVVRNENNVGGYEATNDESPTWKEV